MFREHEKENLTTWMLKNQNKNTATATNIIKVCYSDAKYFAVYAITVSGLSLDNTYVG